MLFSKFDKVLVFFLVTVFAVIFVFAAANVDSAKPYHPIQQVSVSSLSNVSVDQDANGNVDWADNAVKALYATTSGTAITATSSTTSTTSTTSTNSTNATNVLCDGVYKPVSSCSFATKTITTSIKSCNLTSNTGFPTPTNNQAGCTVACDSGSIAVGGGFGLGAVYVRNVLAGFNSYPNGNGWTCEVNIYKDPAPACSNIPEGTYANACNSSCFVLCAKIS
ncbi:MAG: hypothetical protein AABW59_03805 [archaeon]